jgi:hypothetical protein
VEAAYVSLSVHDFGRQAAVERAEHMLRGELPRLPQRADRRLSRDHPQKNWSCDRGYATDAGRTLVDVNRVAVAWECAYEPPDQRCEIGKYEENQKSAR